jgi:uncharacterized protein
MKTIQTAEHRHLRPLPKAPAARDVPRAPWLMTQTWHDLLFAHWPVSVDVLQPLVPQGVDVETFDGTAWLGVVAFRLSAIRLHGLPQVPMLSGFPEVNVRTYVTYGGKPGVYFLSLDADNPFVTMIARPWFHLAYHNARIEMVRTQGRVDFKSRRNDGEDRKDLRARGGTRAEFRASYAPCSGHVRTTPATLEYWLTERYCYYAAGRGSSLYRCEINHPEWSLQTATATIQENTMARSNGVDLPEAPPLLHYARLMKAYIWQPVRLTDRFGL